MLYFSQGVEKNGLKSDESTAGRFILRALLTLVIPETIYFFRLPNYL